MLGFPIFSSISNFTVQILLVFIVRIKVRSWIFKYYVLSIVMWRWSLMTVVWVVFDLQALKEALSKGLAEEWASFCSSGLENSTYKYFKILICICVDVLLSTHGIKIFHKEWPKYHPFPSTYELINLKLNAFRLFSCFFCCVCVSCLIVCVDENNWVRIPFPLLYFWVSFY